MDKTILYVIFIAFFISVRNVLIKKGTGRMNSFTIFYISIMITALLATVFIIWYKPKDLFSNITFLNAGILSGISFIDLIVTLGVIYLISQNNISSIIPTITSTAMIFVFIAGTCFLKEQFTFQKLIGLVLILFGIVLLNYNTTKIIAN